MDYEVRLTKDDLAAVTEGLQALAELLTDSRAEEKRQAVLALNQKLWDLLVSK